MKFLNSVSHSVSGAMKNATEKNRREAAVSRLKRAIKGEEENINEAYIALGKYYYSTLRSEFNSETEPLCIVIDKAEKRIENAQDAIDKILKHGEKNQGWQRKRSFHVSRAVSGSNASDEKAEETVKTDEVAQDFDKDIPW